MKLKKKLNIKKKPVDSWHFIDRKCKMCGCKMRSNSRKIECSFYDCPSKQKSHSFDYLKLAKVNLEIAD